MASLENQHPDALELYSQPPNPQKKETTHQSRCNDLRTREPWLRMISTFHHGLARSSNSQQNASDILYVL